ncbi:MAG: hypothetical protein ACI8UO_001855 [Verrucomicrobiales bacterium]|jgi:hypothetical protein
MKSKSRTLLFLLYPLLASFVTAAESLKVISPPEAEIERLSLDPFYKKYCSASGVPVVASERVDDFALLEAAFLINQMIADRPDIVDALIEGKTRYVIMGHDEFTVDMPEHSQMRPKIFWNKRARGLGSQDHQPAVSCGAENLLGYVGDPYHRENILIHEFAHTIHHQGLSRTDPTFDDRLKSTFERARARGLWNGKYASNNRAEYWAEGVQSWFDTNREDDHDHNHVNTREELIAYDSGLAAMVEEVFGKPEFRYVKPAERAEPGHLAGYDPDKAPEFAWPEELVEAYEAYERGGGLPKLKPLPLEKLEGAKSGDSTERTFLRIRNQTDEPVRIFWIDFEGKRQPKGSIAPKQDWSQETFASHLWLLTDESGEPQQLLETTAEDSQLDLR